MAQMGHLRSARTKLAVALAVIAALAAAALVVIKSGPGSTPSGQPPLAHLANISWFDAEFNAACNQVRVLVLLSPT